MPLDSPTRLDGAALTQPVQIVDPSGNVVLTVTGTKAIRVGASSGTLGFFGTSPAAKPTVPLTTPDAQDVIDALVTLGLVTQSD